MENTPYELYKDHPFLPLYEKDRIPYDEGNGLADRLFIIPYLAEKPNGTALLVFPGGAYRFTDNGADNTGSHQEAGDIAEQFYNAAGISVFVVNYRTKTTAPGCDYRGILSDGRRALRYVCFHAEDFGIDPHRIGVMGFSAGGHLAATLLTQYDSDDAGPSVPRDAVDRLSVKPAFAVLSYAVLSFDSAYCHGGSRKNFLGERKDLFPLFSLETHLSDSLPPLFFWCNMLDPSVPAAADMMIARGLEEIKHPYELHLFDLKDKKHDPGTGQSFINAATWPRLSLEFLNTYVPAKPAGESGDEPSLPPRTSSDPGDFSPTSVLPLWEKGAEVPFSSDKECPPVITAYITAANAPAVLILASSKSPVAADAETGEAVSFLNQQGLNAFVLSHRIVPGDPQSEPILYRHASDAVRALHLLKERRSSLGITRLGVLGFEDSGSLVLSLASTGPEGSCDPEADAVSAEGSEVDFMILGNPDFRPRTPIDYSECMPPTFIFYEVGGPFAGSLLTEAESRMKPSGFPFELHGFASSSPSVMGFGGQDPLFSRVKASLSAWLKFIQIK